MGHVHGPLHLRLNKSTMGVNVHAWWRYGRDDVLGSILTIFLVVITEKALHNFHYFLFLAQGVEMYSIPSISSTNATHIYPYILLQYKKSLYGH